MDGDRPVVDGRDIFESKLQELVWEAFCEGWTFGDEDLPDPECCGYAETTEAHERYNKRIHELLISCLDGPSSDVGSQDETAEAREVGDGVRSDPHLIPRNPNAFVVDEWDPINKITDNFAREMDFRFAYEGKKVAMGHCDLTKNPDGSIRARINFFPQNPR